MRNKSILYAALGSVLDDFAKSSPAGATSRLALEVSQSAPAGDLTDRVVVIIREHHRVARAAEQLETHRQARAGG